MPEDQEAPKPSEPAIPRGLVLLSGLLLTIWLVINSSLELPIVAVGALTSLVLAAIFVHRGEVWSISVTPARVLHFVAYTGVFFRELVKANINMLCYVYSPRIDIRPGIVKVRMPLKSPLGRLALANSIALTPGSLVMDLKGEALFIHWLDVASTDPEEASRIIVDPFAKHLEAVFG